MLQPILFIILEPKTLGGTVKWVEDPGSYFCERSSFLESLRQLKHDINLTLVSLMPHKTWLLLSGIKRTFYGNTIVQYPLPLSILKICSAIKNTER